MDKEIIEKIYEKHLENKEKTGKEYKNAIVEGDGPVEIIAAFKLFKEGINVTVLTSLPNRQIDEVICNDLKWMSELRFIMGTEFINFENLRLMLTNVDISSGDVNFVDMRNMGIVLKERLKILSNYVTNKEGKEGKSFLNYLHETAVMDIETRHEKPLAILGAPGNSSNLLNFTQLKKILTNYEGMTISEADNAIGIPFDLFFCDFTKKIKYASVVINKKDHKEKIFKKFQNMSIETKLMDRNLFFSLIGLFRKSYFLSERIKNRYDDIKGLIQFGLKEEKNNSQIPLTKTGKVYETKEVKLCVLNGEIISVQIYEKEKTIQIDSELPVAIVEFIEEVKNEMEDVKKMNDGELKEKWEEAVIAKEKFNHGQNKKIKEDANKEWQIREEKLKVDISLIDVEKTVSAIKEYNKNSQTKDLAEMLIELLKKPELN
uniref:Uncharacterized protein n=1 Tax=Meloidogyne javanica TaxID=6303 RepID=A0A915LLV6_MELJA